MAPKAVPRSYLRIRADVVVQARTCIYCWESFDQDYSATRCEQTHEAVESLSWLRIRSRWYRHEVLGLL